MKSLLYCGYILVLIVLASSCRAKKEILYDPVEVIQLSNKIGFTIKNNDLAIPLYVETVKWLGTPYRYAGLTRSGIDCSGLVHLVYKNVYQKKIPRSTKELEKESKKISKRKLKSGDLLFFATTKYKDRITHVGIYLKDGYFVHASTSKGVIVSKLDQKYYVNAWKKGGRLK